MNQTMVILSSGSAVKEVLDLQGGLTGNRPQPYLVMQIEREYPVFSNLGMSPIILVSDK